MAVNKSLDPYIQIITTLIRDVQTTHSQVFSKRSMRLTIQKIIQRTEREGISFLTKTLPRLGKALNRALAGDGLLDGTKLRFTTLPDSKLPKFLGELFQQVFANDGSVLPTPCVKSIKSLTEVLAVFYKLELRSSPDDEQRVLDRFLKVEEELVVSDERLDELSKQLQANLHERLLSHDSSFVQIARRARILLSRLFASFDVKDIYPRHGPGAVSTGEKLWGKWSWTNIPTRITDMYPLDEYYYLSQTHVCDSVDSIQLLTSEESSAKVILVPKDSRGPRLISCEPLEFQWIQQGLASSLVQHIENHPLTKGIVNFTDQEPNRRRALSSSLSLGYATLDLNDASDRVSTVLVNLLLPEPLLGALMACRSLGTKLPNGQYLALKKFAPMGSALCFPVLAICTWALLHASITDAQVREDLLVYGDDVIVPIGETEHAIETLEYFGLKVNRDKSCTRGSFRESCGCDAYKGVDVTPVRIRTTWTHHINPSAYTSYVAYANEMYRRSFYQTYDLIVSMLYRTYGPLVAMDQDIPVPSLVEVPEHMRVRRRRRNSKLQKLEYYVLDVVPHKRTRYIDGWMMLMRFCAEGRRRLGTPLDNCMPYGSSTRELIDGICHPSFSASQYTERQRSSLRRRWL